MEKTKWKPFPGPQTHAINCLADELLYGGAKGGGKSEAILGIAGFGPHQRAIIFRREYGELRSLTARGNVIFKNHARFNSNEKTWRFHSGRTVELGAVQHLGDEVKFQGQSHDLICFDEITNFSEEQYRFLIGDNRPLDENTWDPKIHRCRIIATCNPPVNATGDWIMKYWAPWIDAKHPRPAKPGELRYYRTKAGEDIELENGDPYQDEKGNWIRPKSRTFIPAKVEDNPFLMAQGYRDRLEAFPEPLRSKMLYGSFTAGREDVAWQIIPTAWVMEAQKRWVEPDTRRLTQIGVDVARGGADKTIITPVYGEIVGRQICLEGAETPDGTAVAMAISENFPLQTLINIDICGIGAGPYDILRQLNANVQAMNGGESSDETDKSGTLRFYNKRAEWWWRLRELLDPMSDNLLALPPDNELLSDLTAPHWEIKRFSIKVEDKYEIKKRIGRSPDKADSLAYALAKAEIYQEPQYFDYSMMR